MPIHNLTEGGPWWGPESCLVRGKHDRLVAKLDHFASRAGLHGKSKADIWIPVPGDIEPVERAWLRMLARRRAVDDVVYFGSLVGCRRRMQQWTGALIRNFVDARCLSSETLISMLWDSQDIKAQVLFIPDFCVPDETEFKNQKMRTSLVSLYRERQMSGVTTVFYGGEEPLDYRPITRAYGRALAEDLKETCEARYFNPNHSKVA